MMTESQRSADLEAKRQEMIASLPEAARSWLKASLQHDQRELRARASKLRRRFKPDGENAHYATASELIARAYEEAAWAFARALNGLLRPGDMAKALSEDGAGVDDCEAYEKHGVQL